MRLPSATSLHLVSPSQQICPVPPHGEHVVPLQTPFAWHVMPAQHAWPGSPQSPKSGLSWHVPETQSWAGPQSPEVVHPPPVGTWQMLPFAVSQTRPVQQSLLLTQPVPPERTQQRVPAGVVLVTGSHLSVPWHVEGGVPQQPRRR